MTFKKPAKSCQNHTFSLPKHYRIRGAIPSEPGLAARAPATNVMPSDTQANKQWNQRHANTPQVPVKGRD